MSKQLISFKTFMAVILLTLGLLPAVSVHAQKKADMPAGMTIDMESEILFNINKHRTGMGLPPLMPDDNIAKAAERHSKDMAKGRVPFGHDGFDERMKALLKILAPANAAAENVAEGASTADEVVKLWLHSAGHRKNIEGKYTLTGIGIAKDKDGKMFFTQIFINKKQ